MSYRSSFARFLSDYGMLGVLVLLCLLFSVLTMSDQHPVGRDAAVSLISVLPELPPDAGVAIVMQSNGSDSIFAETLLDSLRVRGIAGHLIAGDPAAIRESLRILADEGLSTIAVTMALEPMVRAIRSSVAQLSEAQIVTPPVTRWPTFLLADNVRNVANQIAVIALIAIGMTMVIITAGIDLSVGSLIALSAVIAAWLVGQWGGANASTFAMIAAGTLAVIFSGAVGAFSGLMITQFRIPPFIATLAMMQVAAGLGYIISQGMPIYQLPDGFTALGRSADPLLKIPYAVLLMIGLYIVAHLVMSRTTLGRYIYAVGGNPEAARLAGIRVSGVLIFVYVICGMLAGLGGVVMASQLKSGAPTYGLTYELYVIAAVVVGGTSLSGGEGRIFGTLIGAFIIAVIQNGMNLTNVESYTQKVVLGLVILGAVLLDQLRQRGFLKHLAMQRMARKQVSSDTVEGKE
ncbi:MAG: ABC transporter permease [candidate division Zixibacteria bacterium]|nr:ABC transporter permease [candidate division Zixibacteria bacterium]